MSAHDPGRGRNTKPALLFAPVAAKFHGDFGEVQSHSKDLVKQAPSDGPALQERLDVSQVSGGIRIMQNSTESGFPATTNSFSNTQMRFAKPKSIR